MATPTDGPPESDRLDDLPHPRETAVLFGHHEAEARLLEAFRDGRLAHAWLIGGPRGIGKATLAWRFARFLAAHPDAASPEVRAARDLSVDPRSPPARRIAALAEADTGLIRREWDVRNKRHFTEIRVDDLRAAGRIFRRTAVEGRTRVVILDSVDDLNESSANALLKSIEEPPAKSLFLLIAHRPARVMATIRSRCARLLLRPLGDADMVRAIEATGAEAEPAALRIAIARAGGAPRAALRALGGGAIAVLERVDRLLAALPDIDYLEAQALAEAVSGAGRQLAFEAVQGALFDWLAERVREPGASVAALAPYARTWEKLRQAAREIEALNLDRRPLVLTMFGELAAARRAAHR